MEVQYPEKFRIYIPDPNCAGTIGVDISMPTPDFQRVVLLSDWSDAEGMHYHIIVTLLPGQVYGIYTADGQLFEKMDKVNALAAIANWKNHGLFTPMTF